MVSINSENVICGASEVAVISSNSGLIDIRLLARTMAGPAAAINMAPRKERREKFVAKRQSFKAASIMDLQTSASMYGSGGPASKTASVGSLMASMAALALFLL